MLQIMHIHCWLFMIYWLFLFRQYLTIYWLCQNSFIWRQYTSKMISLAKGYSQNMRNINICYSVFLNINIQVLLDSFMGTDEYNSIQIKCSITQLFSMSYMMIATVLIFSNDIIWWQFIETSRILVTIRTGRFQFHKYGISTSRVCSFWVYYY